MANNQTFFYSVLVAILADKNKVTLRNYFIRAAQNAATQKTIFPRVAYAEQQKAWLAMKPEQAKARLSEILARISLGEGKAVSATSEARAMYDLMRAQENAYLAEAKAKTEKAAATKAARAAGLAKANAARTAKRQVVTA